MDSTQCQRVEPCKGSGYEGVATTRSDWGDLAAMYAHLTGRQVELLNGLEVETIPDSVQVLLTDRRWLTPARARALYQRMLHSSSVGLLLGNVYEELRMQVLLRSAAVRLAPVRRRSDASVFPTLPFAKRSVAGRTLLGQASSSEELADTLSSGCGTLAIATHSDGFDAFLGRLTLCPMDKPLSAEPERAPTCVGSGQCYRHNIPTATVHTSGLGFSPDAVSARALILATCWGTNLEPGLLDPDWGLLRRLLLSGGVGSALATWQITFSPPSHVEPLFRSIARGESLGSALRVFARAEFTRKAGFRFLLFGDPRACTWVGAGLLSSPRAIKSTVALNRVAAVRDIANVGFVLAYLGEVLQSREAQVSEEHWSSHARALEHATAYQRACYNGLDVEEGAGLGADVRQAFLAFVATQGTLPSKIWLMLTYDLELTEQELSCFACGSRVDVHRAALRMAGTYSRTLTNCPLCGIIFDAEEASAPQLQLQGNAVRLAFSEPYETRHWRAHLLVLPDSRLDSRRQYEWPAETTGAPMSHFELPEPLPGGFAYVVLFWMSRCSFSVTRIPVYKPHGRVGEASGKQPAVETHLLDTTET
jgi:hypothetical protein